MLARGAYQADSTRERIKADLCHAKLECPLALEQRADTGGPEMYA